MRGKAGKLRQVEFLSPFPVRHYVMPPPNVRHAPVKQQTVGDAGGVVPLNVQAAAERIAAERRIQHHERT